MARIEWVHQRLRNWALWHERMNSGGLGYATQAAFLADAADRDQPFEARVPVDEVEAGVTHEAVQTLKLGNGHLYKTIELLYLRGVGVKEAGRRMARAESTIKAHLYQADGLLAAWFSERSQRMAQQADAFRKQLEAARPAKLQGPLPPVLKVARKRLALPKRGSFTP